MKWPFGKVLLPCFLFVAPVIYVPIDQDSSSTHFSIDAGRGTYSAVTTNCDGDVVQKGTGESEFVSAGLEHRFSGEQIYMGIRGVYSEQDTADFEAGNISGGRDIPFNRVRNRMLNPYFALDNRWASARFGVVFMEEPLVWGGDKMVFTNGTAPSVAVRFGDSQLNNIQMAFMDTQHLNTFGIAYGLLSIKPNENFRVSAGLSLLGPHRGLGYIAKATVLFRKKIIIGICR